MISLKDVKKYTARFLYEKDIYGEDPLEYSVEQPLIDCIHLLKWLYSLGIYSEKSLEESLIEAKSAIEYMNRPCIDGCDFQDDEVGIFKDFPCDDDMRLEIACIIFSIYLTINFTEIKIVKRFFNNAYDYDNPFDDFENNEQFEYFFKKDFDSSRFYPTKYIDKVDLLVIKKWNNNIYENLIKLFDER